MIKYMVGGLDLIRKVSILSETEKSITIENYGGGKYVYQKRHNFYDFCDTLAEAKRVASFDIDSKINEFSDEIIDLLGKQEKIDNFVESAMELPKRF